MNGMNPSTMPLGRQSIASVQNAVNELSTKTMLAKSIESLDRSVTDLESQVSSLLMRLEPFMLQTTDKGCGPMPPPEPKSAFTVAIDSYGDRVMAQVRQLGDMMQRLDF